MAACCYALGEVSGQLQFVGLCHGVQTTLDLISRYVETPREEIDYLCAGINHMAWFLTLKERESQRDLYPTLRSNIEKPEYYANEKVRCEVMRHFGYFMTESTGHLSEYLPWFRSSKRALDLYCDEPDFGGESGAYYKYASSLAEKYKDVDYLESERTVLGERSVEYCSYILEAKETGRAFRLNGNVRNNGLISNLTEGCCVEVRVEIDQEGLHAAPVGKLPPQLAALNQSNVTVQTLIVEAALSGDPENIVHAMAMDPLTGACCTLREIREMTAEMLEKQRKWLPQFSGKQLRSTPVIAIPQGTKRVQVPLDPALAIANRFEELAERQIQKGR
jgi:alpha-galactosidase